MNQEIQLISGGDGLAVIGKPEAVERFTSTEGLPSKDLGLQRLGPSFSAAADLTHIGSVHLRRDPPMNPSWTSWSPTMGLLGSLTAHARSPVVQSASQAQAAGPI